MKPFSPTKVSKLTGIQIGTVSHHLTGSRLPSRASLVKYITAGLPIEPFLFGRDYAIAHGIRDEAVGLAPKKHKRKPKTSEVSNDQRT